MGEKSFNVAKIVVMTTILSIFGLFSLNSATPVSAASLTLSVPTDALKLDLQPNDTFAKSSDSTISVKTDASGGYTLSIKAKNSNELLNGSNKISSISSNLTEDQYKATGNTNTWGYRPSKFNSLDNTVFLPGPTTSPSTIEKTNVKNDIENNYNFVIGAKVDSSTPIGSYSNTFIFTATANIYKYSITYDLNGGDSSSAPNPNPQTGETEEQTIKLSETKPTRNDYDFLGWCTVNPGTSRTCSGQTYEAGAEYPITDATNTKTLWAIWKRTEELLTSVVKVDDGVTSLNFKVGKNIEMVMVAEQNSGGTNYYKPHYAFAEADITGLPTSEGNTLVITVVPKAGYKLSSWAIEGSETQTWTANGVSGTYKAMKDVTEAECLAAGVEGMNVTDERNNISYTIGDFGSRCWMYSNLRLEPGTTLNTITSAVSSSFTLPAQADADVYWVNHYNHPYAKAVMKACNGTVGYNASSSGGTCDANTYGVTEYYFNWYAAKANPYISSNPFAVREASATNDAKSLGSICPKNWRLLLDNVEISVLTNIWDNNKTENPGRLIASGTYCASYQSGVGTTAFWWSSTREDNYYVDSLRLYNGIVNNDNIFKYDGFPVRCIR